ncbi:hypothetical protein WISP_97898 [Willisornis vidua]|uniref:SGTA protein n=1 Tax=Willisornis vidua TaxID=1566151 RepID=A0ABQ9CZB6_9PASS|nr:hypothetical protein WISP_97898 [Willisornis vidua]
MFGTIGKREVWESSVGILISASAFPWKELEHTRTNSEPVTPSEDDVAEAERLKTEGNEQMKAENFEAAVSFYGKAIELNPANAVYFCNSMSGMISGGHNTMGATGTSPSTNDLASLIQA